MKEKEWQLKNKNEKKKWKFVAAPTAAQSA